METGEEVEVWGEESRCQSPSEDHFETGGPLTVARDIFYIDSCVVFFCTVTIALGSFCGQAGFCFLENIISLSLRLGGFCELLEEST